MVDPPLIGLISMLLVNSLVPSFSTIIPSIGTVFSFFFFYLFVLKIFVSVFKLLLILWFENFLLLIGVVSALKFLFFGFSSKIDFSIFTFESQK